MFHALKRATRWRTNFIIMHTEVKLSDDFLIMALFSYPYLYIFTEGTIRYSHLGGNVRVLVCRIYWKSKKGPGKFEAEKEYHIHLQCLSVTKV